MITFIVNQARSEGIQNDALMHVELAVEEALVNIIRHAYQGGPFGEVEISCVLDQEHNFVVTIRDKGAPFNPLERGTGFDPEDALRKGTEGGFGIFLMTKVMDRVEYSRSEGYNILVLVKHVEGLFSST